MDGHRSSPADDPPLWLSGEGTETDDSWGGRERRAGTASYDGFRVPAPRPGPAAGPPGLRPPVDPHLDPPPGRPHVDPAPTPVGGGEPPETRGYDPGEGRGYGRDLAYADPVLAVPRPHPIAPSTGAEPPGPAAPAAPGAAAGADAAAPVGMAPVDVGRHPAEHPYRVGQYPAEHPYGVGQYPAEHRNLVADPYPAEAAGSAPPAHPVEVPTGPVATVPPRHAGFIPGLNPAHHATEAIDRSALRRPAAAPAPVGDGVYRTRRPALLLGFLAVAALFEIPALRLLFAAAFGPAVYPAGVVSGVLLVLALPVLAWGSAALVGGTGRLPEEPPLRAWTRAPLALLPVGLLLVIAAGLAAG